MSGHVGRGDDDGGHQLAVPIRTDVRFHPEIPLVALLGLVHLRVALPLLVLGGGRRGNQGGVHQRAGPQQQPPRGEVGMDGGEETLAEVMRFEQVAEVQQGRGVGHTFGAQINPRKTLEGLAVVERVFNGFIREAIPLLEEIHP